MTSFVFPTIRGQSWTIKRHTTYKTLTDEAMSRRVSTLALQRYAMYSWELGFELLRDDSTPSDLQAIVGLYNACLGRFDSFLYTDPIYNTANGVVFGVGDGVTTNFQIINYFSNPGGPFGPDIIQNFNGGLPIITDNLGPPGSLSIGPSGIVTFLTPPAFGHNLAWSGSFYFRCKFMEDTLEMSEFMDNWWSAKSVKFASILL